MRTWIATLLIAVCAWAAHAQTVFLKVTFEGSNQDDKTSIEQGGGKAFTEKKHVFRQETIEITVRNTHTEPCEYLIEWLFLASPAKGGGEPEPYHADEKTVTLPPNGTETFQVTSPKMESIQSYYHTFERQRKTGGGYEEKEKTRYLGMEGVKPAGYVVRVKAKQKLVAVEASDAQLKRRYTSPTAPWNPPPKKTEPAQLPAKAPGDKKKPANK